MYSDDITLLCTHRCLGVAASRMQLALEERVSRFLSGIDLSVSAEKTVAQVFSQKQAVVLVDCRCRAGILVCRFSLAEAREASVGGH